MESSINQSNFYRANIPGEARHSGATAKSVFNSKSWGNTLQNFTFRSHISAVCSSCFYHIWHLQRIRCHLDLDSAKLLATALVSSLDYCNSLLYGVADIDLTRLHHVQNRLARLVTKSPPVTRSLPLLRFLYWLPLRYRILFKINLLTYKTLREEKTACSPSLHARRITSIPVARRLETPVLKKPET